VGNHLELIPNQPPAPTPTYDPLAIPVLPENPTQFDIGKNLYYYNCMPCHGDQGQGLTDEWRHVWEEDHQNCWGRGCHGGRQNDEGFPIPTNVPAVILANEGLAPYSNPQVLFIYLQRTHPPQEPGRLAEDDYLALSAYLWQANGKAPVEAVQLPIASITPMATATSQAMASSFEAAMPVASRRTQDFSGGIGGIFLLVVLGVMILLLGRRK
jgi:hypothetical protein